MPRNGALARLQRFGDGPSGRCTAQEGGMPSLKADFSCPRNSGVSLWPWTVIALLSGARDAACKPTQLRADRSRFLASARTKVSDRSAHLPDRLKGRQDAPSVESQQALVSGHLALSKQHAEVISRHLDCFG